MASKNEFHSSKETRYILDSVENRKALDKSIDQLKSGHVKTLSFKDWQRMTKKN